MPNGLPSTDAEASIISGARAMLAVFAADNRGPVGFCFMAGQAAWEEVTTLLSRFAGSTHGFTIDGIPVRLMPSLLPDEFMLCRSIEWESILPKPQP